jgi:hypothetical protein
MWRFPARGGVDTIPPEEDPMPRKRDPVNDDQAPRTDLPPSKEPYYEGYFGTDEEEGVEREREAPSDEGASEEDEEGDQGEP